MRILAATAVYGVSLLSVAVFAQTLSLRIDLARTSVFVVRHPMLLARDGYGVTYQFAAPDEQEVTFPRATPQAEFDEIVVVMIGGEINEVRTSKVGEPSSLIIRPGTAGPVAIWDLPLYLPMTPPAPPGQEVQRRFTLATSLFAKGAEALGLKGLKGGEAGAVTLQLGGVEDLLLRSHGAAALYDYTFFALAKENMVEELRAEATAATLTIEVGPGRVRVGHEATAPDGQRITSELIIEGTVWSGSRETRRPGERPMIRDLMRSEAEQLLAEGLRQLREARLHFSIPFGRDLTSYRLP